MAGFLRVAAMNAFDSHFMENRKKSKAETGSRLMGRINQAVHVPAISFAGTKERAKAFVGGVSGTLQLLTEPLNRWTDRQTRQTKQPNKVYHV